MGLLKSRESVPLLQKIFQKTAWGRVKLAVVSACAEIKNSDCITLLLEALRDPEPNVQWESAVMLAKCGNVGGKRILSSMMERSYWKKFKNVNSKEQNHAIIQAIRSAVLLNDKDLKKKVSLLAARDSNLRVRRIAKRLLKS